VRFICDHQSRFGVEPICRVLTGRGCKIAPSTYYDTVASGSSTPAARDEQPRLAVVRVRVQNHGLCSAHKVLLALNQD
jgi:putative transposase